MVVAFVSSAQQLFGLQCVKFDFMWRSMQKAKGIGKIGSCDLRGVGNLGCSRL